MKDLWKRLNRLYGFSSKQVKIVDIKAELLIEP